MRIVLLPASRWFLENMPLCPDICVQAFSAARRRSILLGALRARRERWVMHVRSSTPYMNCYFFFCYGRLDEVYIPSRTADPPIQKLFCLQLQQRQNNQSLSVLIRYMLIRTAENAAGMQSAEYAGIPASRRLSRRCL